MLCNGHLPYLEDTIRHEAITIVGVVVVERAVRVAVELVVGVGIIRRANKNTPDNRPNSLHPTLRRIVTLFVGGAPFADVFACLFYYFPPVFHSASGKMICSIRHVNQD